MLFRELYRWRLKRAFRPFAPEETLAQLDVHLDNMTEWEAFQRLFFPLRYKTRIAAEDPSLLPLMRNILDCVAKEAETMEREPRNLASQSDTSHAAPNEPTQGAPSRER